MKRIILFVLLFSIGLLLYLFSWKPQLSTVNQLQQDKSGNIYVVGECNRMFDNIHIKQPYVMTLDKSLQRLKKMHFSSEVSAQNVGLLLDDCLLNLVKENLKLLL